MLVTTTSAPGMAAPVGSTTVPSSRLVFPCANTKDAARHTSAASFFIETYPFRNLARLQKQIERIVRQGTCLMQTPLVGSAIANESGGFDAETQRRGEKRGDPVSWVSASSSAPLRQ